MSNGGYRYGVKHTAERQAEIERWYREKIRLGTNKTKALEMGISRQRLEQLLLPIREKICGEGKNLVRDADSKEGGACVQQDLWPDSVRRAG